MKRNSYQRINAYRNMWIFVFFDLPTHSKKLRKKYSEFRKEIVGDGFNMMQYSVYTRNCPSRENADVHIRRLKQSTPKEGHLSILIITDKQYSQIINMIGRSFEPLECAPGQLELF